MLPLAESNPFQTVFGAPPAFFISFPGNLQDDFDILQRRICRGQAKGLKDETDMLAIKTGQIQVAQLSQLSPKNANRAACWFIQPANAVEQRCLAAPGASLNC